MNDFPTFSSCSFENFKQFGQWFDHATIHKEEQHAAIHKEERLVARKLVGHNTAVACGDVGKGANVDNHRRALHCPHDHQQQHVAHDHLESAIAAKVVLQL